MAGYKVPFPYLTDDDEEDQSTDATAAADPSQLSAEGVGDLSQSQPQRFKVPPPSFGQQTALQTHANQGPPPLPNPGIFRKILAGALGGAAGVANTQVGRAGGMKDAIDTSGATSNILGYGTYNRRLKDYQQKEAALEKAAQNERQTNEDVEKYSEQQITSAERLQGVRDRAAALRANAQDRANTQAAARAKDIQSFEQQGVQEGAIPDVPFNSDPSTTFPQFDATAEDPSAPQAKDMPQLPGGAEGLINDLPLLPQPRRSMSGTQANPNYNLATPPIGYQGPPLFMPNALEKARQDDQAKQAAAKGPMYTVTSDDADMLGIPSLVNHQMPQSAFNELVKKMEVPGKAPVAVKPPKEDPNDWLADSHNPDPTISGPAKAKLDDYYKRQEGLRSITQVNSQTPPDQLATLAEDIANYQRKMPDIRAYRGSTQFYTQLESAVKALNPDFHQQYYDTFQGMEKDATTGKIGQQAEALNTMIGHLGVLKQAIAALNNGDMRVLNSISNQLGMETGSNPKAIFQTIVHRLGPEITKSYVAGGGTAGERGTAEEDFNPSLAPNILNGNLAISARLADSKIQAMQQRYLRGTYGRGKQKLISDETEAARQQLMGAGGPAGAKVATKQHIAEYATQKGISVQQATQEFQTSGYTIK